MAIICRLARRSRKGIHALSKPVLGDGNYSTVSSGSCWSGQSPGVLFSAPLLTSLKLLVTEESGFPATPPVLLLECRTTPALSALAPCAGKLSLPTGPDPGRHWAPHVHRWFLQPDRLASRRPGCAFPDEIALTFAGKKTLVYCGKLGVITPQRKVTQLVQKMSLAQAYLLHGQGRRGLSPPLAPNPEWQTWPCWIRGKGNRNTHARSLERGRQQSRERQSGLEDEPQANRECSQQNFEKWRIIFLKRQMSPKTKVSFPTRELWKIDSWFWK